MDKKIKLQTNNILVVRKHDIITVLRFEGCEIVYHLKQHFLCVYEYLDCWKLNKGLRGIKL